MKKKIKRICEGIGIGIWVVAMCWLAASIVVLGLYLTGEVADSTVYLFAIGDSTGAAVLVVAMVVIKLIE